MAYKDDYWISCREAARNYNSRAAQMDELPRRKAEECTAVEDALVWLGQQRDGDAKVEFIRLYLIDQTHDQCGAAHAVGYSEPSGRRITKKFITKLADLLGYR